ncbi:methyltransferase domain-containing protein [Micromonospora sp. AMSO1212t]|uniref:class I SAM-dependent methyltransferase n=1 Tax=Micromonospora sp. AMSO1212t TaxID=2650565 RepID=UPI00124B9802|nr:methyltransferase domain-containing protein [Micromonospora sp. AMSO1212t]KAB1909568.1 methyltransferase domain-containing protein [Micromonospora sp. AMSO1212t]
MSFDVDASAYGRFMGRFAEPLAVRFADAAGVTPGLRALDVGCGTGALTAELVARLGPDAVSAVDPSAPFVEAARVRLPGAEIRRASAELLPFPDGGFDVTLAQLVVHFMTDPVAGLREMARVTRPGGVVAACVWDHAGGRGPLTVFWQAVRSLDPDAHDESGLAGAREEHLAELFTAAGLRDVRSSMLTVRTSFASFDQWWEPYTLGVGPAGDHVQRLDAAGRAALRDRCASLLGERWPMEVPASAWTAIGRTP